MAEARRCDPPPVLNPRAVPYDERFLRLSRAWLSDPEMRRLTDTAPFTPEQQRTWYESLPERTDYVVWGIEVEGAPVGAFGLKGIAGESAEFWGYIGEKTMWGRGIGRWMVEEALARAASRGIRRVCLRVRNDNERAVRLYQRCGFRPCRREGEMAWMDREI